MAPRKAPTDTTNTTPTNGLPDGRHEIGDFDAFLERARADAASLLPHVWVAEAGADGRSFGSRLGKLPLQPLDDLDERIRAEWPGPRVLVVRTKRAAGGTIAHTGRLALAAPAPTAAPTATTGDATALALVAALQRQVADLTAQLTARAAPPAAPPPLDSQVGALASVAQVVRSLAPSADGTAKGLTLEDVKGLLDLGKRSAGDTSLAIEAIRQLGPPVGDVLKATAALLAVKASKATE